MRLHAADIAVAAMTATQRAATEMVLERLAAIGRAELGTRWQAGSVPPNRQDHFDMDLWLMTARIADAASPFSACKRSVARAALRRQLPRLMIAAGDLAYPLANRLALADAIDRVTGGWAATD